MDMVARTLSFVMNASMCRFVILEVAILLCMMATTDGVSDRHSYSLSTFNPSGDLVQVTHAVRASQSGVPVVALSSSRDREMDGVYFASPQRLLASSPLASEDGTPRFVQITDSICLGHTGVTSDGRALIAKATELALSHRYVYGIEITQEELLAGLSAEMQSYTHKPGCRPYGALIVVGCLGSEDDEHTVFQVDPSGTIRSLTALHRSHEEETATSAAAFVGNWNAHDTMSMKRNLERRTFESEEQIQAALAELARATYYDGALSGKREDKYTPVMIVSFSRRRGLQINEVDRR